MTGGERFNAADLCMTLACTPPQEWAAIIAGDPRKQRIADHFLAVAAQAPTPGPVQRGIVRSVFRRTRMAAEHAEASKPPPGKGIRPERSSVGGDARG